MTWNVVKRKNGLFISVIAGMGRNAGTWESAAFSRRTAQRWAAKMRAEEIESGVTYRAEEEGAE